jgi:transposase
MARPYSVDLRGRVVRAVEAGLSRRAAAAKYEVSVSFGVKLMRRWREHGPVQPRRIGGAKRSTLAPHAERVHALLAAEPELTIAELCGRLAAAGTGAGRSARGRFLVAAGLTRKKSQHAAEQDRPDVAAARLAWRVRHPILRPERLVFIDETWATTAMARRYSRARRLPEAEPMPCLCLANRGECGSAWNIDPLSGRIGVQI